MFQIINANLSNKLKEQKNDEVIQSATKTLKLFN